jgi:predicted DNA-binding transcriptional regulator AlpA
MKAMKKAAAGAERRKRMLADTVAAQAKGEPDMSDVVMIPRAVAQLVSVVMGIMGAMVRVAQQEAKTKPSPGNVYPVTLLMDWDGNVGFDESGQPSVVVPPLLVADVTADSVVFHFPHELLKPKQVAELAGVHVATVKRAVYDGELAKPERISSRRIGHKLADVLDWYGDRKAGELRVNRRHADRNRRRG